MSNIDHTINFLEFIQSFRRGELLRHGDRELANIIEAISDTGGDGKLVIELPFKRNKAGQIECTPKIKATVPQHPLGTGIYFASEDGGLSRRDPNQYDIEDPVAPGRIPAASQIPRNGDSDRRRYRIAGFLRPEVATEFSF